MEKPEKISDSDHSPSENGKHVEGGAPVNIINLHDPDEGLSEEERKKIVSDISF